jgi:hypothetical protein
MLASASLTHFKTRLEQLTREALNTGLLSKAAEHEIRTISHQSNLGPEELRILEILNDALLWGTIQHVQDS